MAGKPRVLTAKQLDLLRGIATRRTVMKFSHAAGYARFDDDFKVWRQVPWAQVRPLIDGGLVESADGLNSYRVTAAGRVAIETGRYRAPGHPDAFVSRAGRDVLALLHRGGTLRRTAFAFEGAEGGAACPVQANVVAALHRQGYVAFAAVGTVEAWELHMTDAGRAAYEEIVGVTEAPHYELGENGA